MTIVNYKKINPNLHNYNDFKLAVRNSRKQILITMSMQKPHYYTKSLPNTYEILKNSLPQIFASLCFNNSKSPFYNEVKNTETGHLFEHILLEYLCETKINSGFPNASFKGLTRWDWKKDTFGIYHIEIGINPEDLEFFELALEKSINLFNKILTGDTKIFASLSN